MSFITNVNGLSKYLKDVNPFEAERMAFTVHEGELLSIKNQLEKELLLLSSFLAFEVDCSYKRYSDLVHSVEFYKEVLDKVEEDQDILIIETLKRVIVYLQLEVGCKVSFVTTFLDMKKDNTLDIAYSSYEKIGSLTPDVLFMIFYNDLLRIRKNENKYEENINVKVEYLNEYEDMFKNDYEFLYKKNYSKQDAFEDYKIYKYSFKDISLKVNKLKNVNFDLYQAIVTLVRDIKKKYLSNDYSYFDDKGLFVEQVITYLEYFFELNPTFPQVYAYMYYEKNLDYDINMLLKLGKLNMESLEELFRPGKTYRK